MSYGVPTGAITLEGGEVITSPVIQTSQNGWIYKPAEARTKSEIRSGKGKAWPRKTARTNAQEWLRSWIARQIISRNMPKIIAIERPITDPVPYSVRQAAKIGYGNDILGFAYRDPTWGWVQATVTIAEDGSSSKNGFTLVYKLSVHEFLHHMVQGNLDTELPLRGVGAAKPETFKSNPVHLVDQKTVQKDIAKFVEDPLVHALNRIRAWDKDRLVDNLTIPEKVLFEINTENGKGNSFVYGDEEQYATWYDERGHLWPFGAVEDILLDKQSWAAVENLFQALSFIGYDIRGDFGYSYGDSGRPVRSITMSIPADTQARRGKPTNLHGHEIILNATTGNIAVQCGYVTDEDRWLEYEKRKAQHMYAELERDLRVEEWEIDLTGKEE